jgi:hypothetical protein
MNNSRGNAGVKGGFGKNKREIGALLFKPNAIDK